MQNTNSYSARYAEVMGVLNDSLGSAATRRACAHSLWMKATVLCQRPKWARAQQASDAPKESFADAWKEANGYCMAIQKTRSELTVRPYYKGEEQDFMDLAAPYAHLLVLCDRFGITLDEVPA